MTASPTTEQLLVQVLLRSMQEVLRGLRGGDDGGPRDAPRRLALAFAPVWHRIPFLTLTVENGGLAWDGARVLDAAEDSEGLVQALAKAGVETLTLAPGAEDGEAEQFLLAIDRARSHGQGEAPDLLTALFREDLQHVRYAVAPTDTVPTIEISTVVLQDLAEGEASGQVRDAVREEATDDDPTRGVVQLEKFDSTLYFLDRMEIEGLRSAIAAEYARDPATTTIALLLDVLALQRDASVRDEVIGILEDLMPHLFSTGRFRAVAYVISEVRGVAREAEEITAEQKAALDRLRASVSEPDAIAQLFYALESGRVTPSKESLDVLLRELRPQAIRGVLGWLDALTRPEAKSALGEAVDAFFTQWPNALSRMLNSPDIGVVRAALELASRLRLPDFVDSVSALVEHEEPAVRTQVAQTLATIGSAPALRSLVQMADDAESGVRVIVYRALASRPFRSGSASLEKAMAAGDLEDRGVKERRALFRAYGTIAGPGGVALLESLLRGKNPGGRRPSPETRACAALGLGIIGTPGARSALQGATSDRDPVVRSAANAALRGES